MKQEIIKSLFLVILGIVLLTTTKMSAQVYIYGNVYDKENEPLENILVMLLHNSDSSVACYTLTDSEGYYSLEYLESDFNMIISISRIGIQKQIKKITNQNQEINFFAERSVTKLDDVEIIAEREWRTGDTLNFLLPAYISRNDMVIGDAMKRIPGMKIYDNGNISYRGRSIQSLYIEGVDVSNGRYGVMTNSISAKDVCVVQIWEYHQPIKVLEKTHFSDGVSVNIKKIKSAKEKRKANASLGLGGDFNKNILWKGEFLGTYVGQKHQHFLSYKTNNAGLDVRRDQGVNSYFTLSNSPFTQMLMPSTPAIDLKHYFLNNTRAITAQNHYKASENTELIYNFRYSYNEEKRRSFSSIAYTIPGKDLKTVNEEITTEMNTHNVEVDLQYKYNSEKTFFNNYLNVTGVFDDGKGNIETSNLMNQKYQSKSIEAVNNTHFIKKKANGENGIDLNLTQAFISQPHQLSVTPGLYPNIFNDSISYYMLQQQVRYNAFSSGNKLSFLNAISFYGISLNPTMYFNLDGQYLSSHLESSLTSHSPMRMIEEPTMRNGSDWMDVDAGASMEVFYNTRRFNFNLKLPVSHDWYFLNNKYKAVPGTSTRWTFQPSLYMRLKLSNAFDLSTSASLSDFSPNIRSQYTGNILQNYRVLNHYDANEYHSKTFNSVTTLSYRNAKKHLFSNISFIYQQIVSNGIYGQKFEGNLISTELTMRDNMATGYRVNWDASKGFDWQQLLVSTQISVGGSDNDRLRQGIFLKSYSQWSQIQLSANMTTTSGLSVRYSSKWYASVAQEGNDKKHPAMHTFNNSLRVDFSLWKNINVFSVCDYYFTRTQNGDKHFSIFDIGVEYSYGPIKYSLLWNNILNTKHYISSFYSNMNSYYSEYSIRPASIMLNLQFNLF